MNRKMINATLLTVLFFLGLTLKTQAQQKIMNMPEHDSKWYYFGLTFGFSYATFQVSPNNNFAASDSFMLVQPHWGPGFSLGIMGNLRLSNFVDFRFVPALIFTEKKLEIQGYTNDFIYADETKMLESIYLQLPFQFKFKSDRINNFRFYGIAGTKFDYDLASNSRSRRSDEWLRVKPIDIGAEVGVGFEFFYPNFIFAPEIKLSQGFLNEHFHDPDIPLSNAIGRMRTRMIVISIHLEG